MSLLPQRRAVSSPPLRPSCLNRADVLDPSSAAAVDINPRYYGSLSPTVAEHQALPRGQQEVSGASHLFNDVSGFSRQELWVMNLVINDPVKHLLLIVTWEWRLRHRQSATHVTSSCV